MRELRIENDIGFVVFVQTVRFALFFYYIYIYIFIYIFFGQMVRFPPFVFVFFFEFWPKSAGSALVSVAAADTD